MSIKMGASGVLFCDRFTLDCHVVETRQYPYRICDCWGVTQKALNNNIYLIFNISWKSSESSQSYNPTDWEWKHRVEMVVQKLISYGGNKKNCRITIINEPMKRLTKEKYTHLINLAYSQINGRFLMGAGNEEFLLAQAKGNMYEYILRYGSFDVLDIHIQGSCLKESDCSKWTNLALNWATSHKKILDCTEANYSDVAKESGYKTLLMQLRYAEKIRCIHFPMVFIGLSNEDKYKWLSFIYNGKVRSPYWEDFKRIMKAKAWVPIPEPIIISEEDMKLKNLKEGSTGNQVRILQEILMIEYGFQNEYENPFDGKFGNLTDKQVKEYQQANGLKVDGWVGINTMTDLILGVDRKPAVDRKFTTDYWFKKLQIYMAYE